MLTYSYYKLTGAKECVLIWWLPHWIFDLKKGYEAVRYFLSFPYTADIIKSLCFRFLLVKKRLLLRCNMTANGEGKQGGKDGHVVIFPISASCVCPLRLGEALSL